MNFYTVEWGHYEHEGRYKVQDGDQELYAKDEADAIAKSYAPKGAEWVHVYMGSSKWG